MPVGLTVPTLVKAGCLENDTINILNSVFNNVPGIVGTPVNNNAVPFGNFTTAGTTVTLVPAGTAGTFRLGVFGVVTTAFVTNASENLTFGWTDDNGAHTQALNIAIGLGSVGNLTIIVRSTGAAAITLTEAGVTSNATAGAMAISAFAERLV